MFFLQFPFSYNLQLITMRPTILTFSLLLFIIGSSLELVQAFPLLLSHHRRRSQETLDDDQCIPVNFIDGQMGLVNVIAFLDSTWPFSYKQASMLKILKDRLERSGMPEILFFVIINDFSAIGDLESDLEELTWINIVPEEVLELRKIFGNLSEPVLGSFNNSLRLLEKVISPDIFIIEDNNNLGFSEDLNGTRDQILVVDRCGKITYRIIVPWSILHLPYVKAAILSTYKDDPCGPCDAYATVIDYDQLGDTSTSRDTEEESKADEEFMKTSENNSKLEENQKFYASEDSLSNSDAQSTPLNMEEAHGDDEGEIENQIPSLRVIMHAPHYHINEDSTKKHEYLVLEFDKPKYHGHLDTSDAYRHEEGTRRKSDVILDSIIYEKNESPGFYGELADFWSESNAEDIVDESDEDVEGLDPSSISSLGQIGGSNGVSEMNVENFATPLIQSEFETREYGTETPDEKTNKKQEVEEASDKLISHYSKLLPWIYYALNN